MKAKPSFHCGCRIIFLFLVGVFATLRALAAVITLDSIANASAVDEGPQDGVFDAFVLNTGEFSVNNNGFTSFRGALEFELTSVPIGASINAASLTFTISSVDGIRQIQLHGYVGDGTITLDDFAENGLVGSTTLNPPGSEKVIFDATPLVETLVKSGERFAGFNLREEPPNVSNFLVLFFGKEGPPRPQLSIDFTPPLQPVPESFGTWLAGASFLVLLVGRVLIDEKETRHLRSRTLSSNLGPRSGPIK
jgi:hypothetical protein